MPASFPRAISASALGAGQCRRPKVESAIRSATSGEQAPAPAWRVRNPGTHNNSAEQEPDGFLPVQGVGAGATELPS